jgi:hypothetical protein
VFRLSRLIALVVLLASAVFAQDQRTVKSPDGQVEFRIFVAQPEEGGVSRLGYQILYQGKRVVDTSFLGFDIRDQEPLLGENAGLIATSTASTPQYNSLVTHYMQNGSLGRLLDVEIRAYNDRVAFRYTIPPSTPLLDLQIVEERTEFAVEPGAPVSIDEEPAPGYPPMSLVRAEPNVLLTHLSHPYDGKPPLTSSWRVIHVGPKRS